MCHYSGNELPPNTQRTSDSGSKIKFHPNELIEDSTTSENKPYDMIMSKCAVFKARENESVTELLQNKKKSAMAYICRYKLVKETFGYRLEPVSWQPGEEEFRMYADEFSDMDDQHIHTDTDTQSEVIVDLNETLDQIQLSLQNDSEGDSPVKQLSLPKRVTPICIVNNTVYKSTRKQNKSRAGDKRASPDAKMDDQDVSPSKRNKLTEEHNSHLPLDSPKNQTSKYSSPALDRMEKVKKNLNRSSFMTDAPTDTDEMPCSPYETIKVNDKNPMKMTLRKKSTEQKTPLKERNENTIISQDMLRTAETPASVAQRRILKSENSTRSKTFYLDISRFFWTEHFLLLSYVLVL